MANATQIQDFLSKIFNNFPQDNIFKECLDYFCGSDKKFYEIINILAPDLDIHSCKEISDTVFYDKPISKEKDAKIQQLLATDSCFVNLRTRYSNGEEISSKQLLKAFLNNNALKISSY